MPTSTTSRETPRKRADNATSMVRQALALPVRPGDANAFVAALAEIAAEESKRNRRFADAIRNRYDELMHEQSTALKSKKTSKADLPPLVPIRRIDGYQADPFSPPDTRFLAQLYGETQLPRALHDYTLDMLKEAALKVQANHPGTKPTSRANKAAVIAYLVKYSNG